MSKTLTRSALVMFSAQQMFDLVNDIEAYPLFMQGCVAAKVLSREPNRVTARLELQKMGIKQAFTTCNTLVPGESIHLQLQEGPFKRFEGLWRFIPLQANACKVEFSLTYEFGNLLLGLAAGKWMEAVASEQVDALCARARVVYGAG
jgi:ribosome-associated toxin RatA of RatAB toxin-antitoxin module